METQKIEMIDSQVKKLTEDLTKYQEHLTKNILPEIKKLREQKKAFITDIATMNGAIQAYQASSSLFKQPSEPVSEANAVEVVQ